jgi:purine-binding chemotaxis protein CheW
MDTSPLSLLEFRLTQNAYGIPVQLVREIDRVGDITPLPNSSPFVCGLMNLRGQVIPVIDLKVRLGEPRTPLTRQSCVIVVDSPDGLMGLLVDAVSRVLNVEAADVLPTPDTCHLMDKSLASSVAKEGGRLLTVLNVSQCLETVGAKGTEPSRPGVLDHAVKLLS